MSQIPRPVVDTTVPCAMCGTALKVTFDALNRPRHRCPSCHGVVTTPIDAGVVAHVPTPTVEHAQLKPTRQQLQRLALTARPVVAPPLGAVRAAAIASRDRRCVDCGAPLPKQVGRGRPRLRCADAQACRERAA